MTSKPDQIPERGLDVPAGDALSEGDVERIACRVAALLRDRQARAPGGRGKEWVKADVIAKRFGVSRAWVYENADALGALRIGGSTKNLLRFDPEVVRERIEAVGRRAPTRPRQPMRRPPSSEADLLPIRQRPRV